MNWCKVDMGLCENLIDQSAWRLTYIDPVFDFYTPWKRQKTFDFL